MIILVLIASVIYVLCAASIPAFIDPKERSTRLCLIWPDENQNVDYPRHVLRSSPVLSATAFAVYFSVHASVWLLVTLCNCSMYAMILRTMHIRTKNTRLSTDPNGHHDKQLRQVAIMVISNGTIFFVCCSVQFINQIMHILNQNAIAVFNDERYSYSWKHVVNLAIGLNASINPLIYLMTNQRYRIAFIAGLVKCCCNVHGWRSG